MAEPTKIFVGNLVYQCEDNDLYDHFGQCGKVIDAVVISDRETGRSRGFGFVTFENYEEANKAIKELHESDLKGRNISVKPAENKRGGGGGGYGGGGGGYGGGRRDNYGGGGGGRSYGGGGGRRDYNDDGYQGGGGGYRGGNDSGYKGSGGYSNRGGGDRY